METIRNYIETMFSTWPGGEATERVKGQMLEIMEDKYQELISQGKSPNEAIGQVITEFGNIEELKQELGISTEVPISADEPSAYFRAEAERKKKVWKSLLDDNYWIIVTALYFLISFTTGQWGYTWIIWVLATGLESTIRQLVGLSEEETEEKS